MKYLLFILLLLAACTKEPLEEELHMAQLSVEGKGNYVITYGTSNHITLKGKDDWSAYLSVNHGDTLRFSINTSLSPATLYMRVEIQEEILYCKSLYVEPQSTGQMIFIHEP
jgi:hypothetical protein